MTARRRSGNQGAPHSLAHLLSNLSRRHATGFLTSSSTGVQREIILIDGEVRAARSTVEDEMLGLWLVQQGIIVETDRARALLAQGEATAPPLGHVLVTRNLIEKNQLEEQLQALALTIIERAVKDSGASYGFLDNPEAEHPDTLGDLTTTQVILNAARAHDDIDAMTTILGDPDQVVTAEDDLPTLIEVLTLTPTEMFILSRLNSKPNLAALYRMSSLPEEQAVKTVFGLVMARLIGLSPAADSGRTADPQGTMNDPQTVDTAELSQRQKEERRIVQELAEDCNRLDHYEALGIKRDAAPVEILDSWNAIRERYRSERTREYHLGDCGPLLDVIRERALAAYQVLGAAKSRRRYDAIVSDIDKEKNRFKVSKRDTDAGVRSAIVVANLKRADELVREGEIHLAVQLLEQACAIEPRPLELVKLARLQVRNPLWESRVLKCLRQAIEVDPECVEAWLELAEFWRRRRIPERQRKSLERILAIDPDHQRANLMYRQLVGVGPLTKIRRLARLQRR